MKSYRSAADTGTRHKLGRYEIRSKIGAGGMGEVYRARDEKLNRDVAIKIVPTTLSENGDRLHWFEQARRSISDLSSDMQLDFTATLERHSISGRILNARGEPIAGVTMMLSGSTNAVTTTAAFSAYKHPIVNRTPSHAQ